MPKSKHAAGPSEATEKEIVRKLPAKGKKPFFLSKKKKYARY